jgi:hypothetical protein
MTDDRFKFRVFDSNGIMTYLTGFAIPDFVKEGDGELNFVGLQGGFGGQIKGKLKDFQLMQCTGLKDKNGKLIYEGDVVKVSEVVFSTKEEVYYNCEVRPIRPFHGYDFTYGEEGLKYVEVLGNKFENPELLNKMEEKQ